MAGETVMLVHGVGSPGSHDIVDVITGGIFTASAGVSISSGSSNFGDTSIRADGSGYVRSPANPKLAIGADDFTLGLWLCPVNGGLGDPYGRAIIIGDTASPGELHLARGNSPGTFFWEYADSSGSYHYIITGNFRATVLHDNVWSHVALTRRSGISRAFINGALTDTATPSYTVMPTYLQIGGDSKSTGENLNAYIDELRVIRGEALYTASFTPSPRRFNAMDVPVVTTVDGVASSRRVRVCAVDGSKILGSATTATDGTATVPIVNDTAQSVMVYADDDYGDYWRTGTVYGANAKTFATVPNGHWYQTTSGGTSGAVEPSWPTDGTTVTDGSVTWTDMGTMRAPVIQGPFIPVAAS